MKPNFSIVERTKKHLCCILAVFLLNTTAIAQNWDQIIKAAASDRGQTTFNDRADEDYFGYSVAISGDYAIVGAYFQDQHDNIDQSFQYNAGAAYIFIRSGNTWVQQQKLVAGDRDAGDRFGWSVAIGGDFAIVGAPDDASVTGGSAGSAYIFMRSGNAWMQQQKIVASDRAEGDRFGLSVAINGDYVIVGAFREDNDVLGGSPLIDAGSAYIFMRSGNTWTQQQKIVAADRAATDWFGYSVAISGDYAVVGAYQEDENAIGGVTLSNAGAAYIFVRSGATWAQQQKIVADDRGADDGFGHSVAISGDYVIVGALLEDEDASGGATLSDAGAAYIFMRSGNTWTQQQKIVAADIAAIDQFGVSVAIDGDYVIVGARYEDENASGGATLLNAGSAYIFKRSGTTWTQQQKLVASDRGIEDRFGISVAISGNYALVGAFLEDEDASGGATLVNAGAAYFFNRPTNTNTWSQQNKVTPKPLLVGSNLFGYSIAISGDYAIVGAHQEDGDANGGNRLANAGAAYIFVRTGNTWTQQQKLVAGDRAAGDGFGWSVSINGDYAIVGVPDEDENAIGGATLDLAGSAYIFVRSGTTWTQQQKIVPADRAVGDKFGLSVAINGDYAIVSTFQEDENALGGSPLNEAGSAYIFMRSGTTWTQQQKIVAADRAATDWFGYSVAINGDYAVVGAYQEDENAIGGATLSNAGAAYIFVRSGATWAQQQKIVADDRGAADGFGHSVAISGDYVIVGALLEDEDASGGATLSNAGAAYIFMRSGTTWTQQQKIVAADRAAIDQFGVSVAIDGDYVIVGARFEDEDASGGATLFAAGSAYIFKRSGTTWTQQQKLVASDRGIEDRFGISVAISGNYALVGAFLEDEDALSQNRITNTGSVYFFSNSPGANPCNALVTLVPSGLKPFWGTQVANPNIFYFGVTQWKDITASITGGVGPYSYSWSINGPATMVPRSSSNSVAIFEPLGTVTVTVQVTDHGANCTKTQSIQIVWDDQFYCGNLNSTNPLEYWKIKVCEAGQTFCLPWSVAKNKIAANQAVLGSCMPKGDMLTRQNFVMEIFPNPNNGEFRVSAHNVAAQAWFEIFDMSAKRIYTERISTKEGQFVRTFNLQPLPPGMYFIQINDGQNLTTHKVVVN